MISSVDKAGQGAVQPQAATSRAAKPAARPAAKRATKPAAKPATEPAAKPPVKAAAKPSTKTKADKPAFKAAAKPADKPVGKTAAPAAPAKPVKVKVVRDSFTMPSHEYAVLGKLKQRALTAAHHAKKSELLRAGIKLLASLDDAALLRTLSTLPAIKTGRPKAKKGD